MPTRLLFIGVDALDKDLVVTWANDGTLPTFRRLFRDGAWGISENPPGFFVGAIWPSFWTCVGPDRHGRTCYEQLRPGTYETFRVRPTDVRGPAFWNALSDAGRRVAVVDIPKTLVTPSFNGVHVVDWGTHDPDWDGPLTWPTALADELVSRYGRNPVSNCNEHGREGRYEDLRDALLGRIETKRRMLRDLLATERWDAVIAAFADSHCVGHQCWHVHDPSHAGHDDDLARRIGDPVRDVYAALDRAVGDVIEAAGPETDVIVLGSHGMHAHYNATFLLDAMLRRIENPRAPAPRTQSRMKRAWRVVPRPVRRLLSPFTGRARSRLGISDAASRRFFPVPNGDLYGAIRVNLVGREPQGRVQPGDEFERVCASLQADLAGFVNADTGAPAVACVWRTRDVYHGPLIDHLPDLIVEWNREAPFARVRAEKTGEIAGEYTRCRTGEHTPHGIFFATGPTVTAGSIGHPVSVMDFGPTIAERLGVALPDVEGRSFAATMFRGASA
jgi:predicted AlkP superfamily phosphohydrolase/phosphomutase